MCPGYRFLVDMLYFFYFCSFSFGFCVNSMVSLVRLLSLLLSLSYYHYYYGSKIELAIVLGSSCFLNLSSFSFG